MSEKENQPLKQDIDKALKLITPEPIAQSIQQENECIFQNLRELRSVIDNLQEKLETYHDSIDCHLEYWLDPYSHRQNFWSSMDILTCGLTYCWRLPESKMCRLKAHVWLRSLFHCHQDAIPEHSMDHQEDNESPQKIAVESSKDKAVVMKSIKDARGVGGSSCLHHRNKLKSFKRSTIQIVEDHREVSYENQKYGSLADNIFNLDFLAETLDSQVKFIKFFPSFFFLSLIMLVIPLIPYIIVFWVVFESKHRRYLYTLATFYSREVYRGPTVDITTTSKLLTHLGFNILALMVGFGFWGSIVYFVKHEDQLFSTKNNNFFDVLCLSFCNLIIALILLITSILGSLSGNHHLIISQQQYIQHEMQSCLIDTDLFYLEFITNKFGDPLLSYIMKSNPDHMDNKWLLEQTKISEVPKNWSGMCELLELYLLTYHQESLTKNNFLKNHFYAEASKNISSTRNEEQKSNNKESEKRQNSLNVFSRFLERDQEMQKKLRKQSRQFEKDLIYFILELFDLDLRERLIDDLNQNYLVDRKQRHQVAKQIQKRYSEYNGDGKDQILLESIKLIKMKDLRHQYHVRIFTVNKHQYGVNIQRLINVLVEVAIFLISIGRIILHMLFFIIYNKDDIDSSYKLSMSAFDLTILIVILINFLLYEVIRKDTVGISINRIKQKNALIRLTNLISWEKDSSYFIPKEVPTMNLYCKNSWITWYNARRVVESYHETQKNIQDFAQSIVGLYALVIIFFMIVDYYGTLWEKNKFFDDKLLFYLMAIDLLVITYQILLNLLTGCDINELFNVQINRITEFQLFIKNLSQQIDLIFDQQPKLGKESKSILRRLQALALIKREVALKQVYQDGQTTEPDSPYGKSDVCEEKLKTIEKSDINDYLDSLADILDTIMNHLNYDAQIRQEKFLGFIPVTYDYMTALAMSILPIIGGIIWTQITSAAEAGGAR